MRTSTPLIRRVALCAAVGLIVFAPPTPARGQTQENAAPAAAPEAGGTPDPIDPSKPMGPEDPFNRGTPRGSMYGYLKACHDGDYERATEFLDLRRIPAGERAARGPELARQFKFVLDRTYWVEFELLSPTNDGNSDDGLPAWQDRLTRIETADGAVSLLLQRVPRDGDRVRIWKLSADTVSRIPALYEEFGYGPLMDVLPPVFFEARLFEVALWQWIGLLLLAGIAWLVSLLLSTLVIRILHALYVRGSEGALDRRLVLVVQGPIRLALATAILRAGHPLLGLSVPAHEAMRNLEQLLAIVAFAWFFFRLIDLGSLALHQRMVQEGQAGLVPVLSPGRRIIKALLLGIAFLAILASLGVNVTAAVAGLGVGGIAVALAAQKTIENLFGGVTLFADQPVRVGDFCRFGDRVGTVEEIGLRSTRVRTLDRTLVSIPNAEFSQLYLENFAKRDRIWLSTKIGVRYETTPEQLRYTLARLREVLLAHPKVDNDPARVRFVGFGACSLDLEVFAYVLTSDWSEFLEVREDVYLRFMDVIAEAGTGFAFPSQTIYVGQDDGLDVQAGREAAERVEAWRNEGALPFPQFPTEFRQRVIDTLDYPPEGSPGRPRRTRAQGADEA